ncbi:MAG: YigZ family protein [Neisseriaceae bacterium]|nr:YigZ family protein [Neisseriaceae bacterium]
MHYDARHTVFAYRLRKGSIDRCSDDGEPQGTGGQPVLEVLRRSELHFHPA